MAELPEKTLIHATGYGARALFRDETIVPVRGQIAWLIPQPEARYAVMYRGLYLLARRDGIVVQSLGKGEMEGYGETDVRPDRAAAEAWVKTASELFATMRV